MLMVELPEPGKGMDVGLKLTVTPAGWPVADKAIAELNPSRTVVVIVDVPLLPRITETEVGDAKMLKLADVDTPESALISALPLGLPQPVARSYPISAG
jgi:hypothetical protein